MTGAVVAAETREAAEDAEADDEAGSNDGCLKAAFLGDVNAPEPAMEANVAKDAPSPLPGSALAEAPTPPTMGDILRRDSPPILLLSLAEPTFFKFWDFGDAVGVLRSFEAIVACDLASAKLRSSTDISASMAEKKLPGSSGWGVGIECDAAKDLAATNNRGGGG
jgi:hypothetical protein